MGSLTKKEEKLIASLQQKKFRRIEECFVVEGKKMVEEALQSSWKVRFVVTSIDFESDQTEVKVCDAQSMQRISSFKTPPGVIAVVELPQDNDLVESPITLLVEKVQDPGNLGTMIRTAEALGVQQMVCSPDCVDHFSSKVVQASMGSILRMKIKVIVPIDYLSQLTKETTIYAAHLKGENLYHHKLTTPAVLIVGNESQGISDELTAMVTQRIKIPMVGKAESFNVSIATAIILSEFSRQLIS